MGRFLKGLGQFSSGLSQGLQPLVRTRQEEKRERRADTRQRGMETRRNKEQRERDARLARQTQERDELLNRQAMDRDAERSLQAQVLDANRDLDARNRAQIITPAQQAQIDAAQSRQAVTDYELQQRRDPTNSPEARIQRDIRDRAASLSPEQQLTYYKGQASANKAIGGYDWAPEIEIAKEAVRTAKKESMAEKGRAIIGTMIASGNGIDRDVLSTLVRSHFGGDWSDPAVKEAAGAPTTGVPDSELVPPVQRPAGATQPGAQPTTRPVDASTRTSTPAQGAPSQAAAGQSPELRAMLKGMTPEERRSFAEGRARFPNKSAEGIAQIILDQRPEQAPAGRPPVEMGRGGPVKTAAPIDTSRITPTPVVQGTRATVGNPTPSQPPPTAKANASPLNQPPPQALSRDEELMARADSAAASSPLGPEAMPEDVGDAEQARQDAATAPEMASLRQEAEGAIKAAGLSRMDLELAMVNLRNAKTPEEVRALIASLQDEGNRFMGGGVQNASDVLNANVARRGRR